MDLSAMKTAIVTWAAAVEPAATVFWGEPNGPRPPAPSIRLKLIGGPTMIGIDEMRDQVGDPNNFTVVGPRELTLSVTAYGPGAQQIASDLQTSLSDPANQATLESGNVSSLGMSPIRDLSALLDTQFEQRFQFDIEMLAMEQLTVTPGVVQHVTATGTVTGSASPPITLPIAT